MAMQSELPGTYRRVEYLESSGTQYIDTGVSGGNTSTHPSYEITFMPLTSQKKLATILRGGYSANGHT